MPRSIILSFSLVMIFGLTACTGNKYLSQPADSNFRIDGFQTEWEGRFKTLKAQDFAIAISYDNNYLYLAISSLDQKFRRSLSMRGFTLWIDPKGGKREELGIKYEGVMNRHGASRRMDPQKMESIRRHPGDMRSEGLSIEGDLDLIVIENHSKRMGPADLLATASEDRDILFLEYQIPLVLLGENFKPENKLGIGLISEIDRDKIRPPDRGGMSAGTPGGMSGGQRGGKGRSGGMHANRPDLSSIEAWIQVKSAP